MIFDLFPNPAHLNNRNAILKAVICIESRKVKKKKKTNECILLSFLSDVYMECMNVMKVKLFTHISENVQAITKNQIYISSVAWTSSSLIWLIFYICLFLNKPSWKLSTL